MSATPGQGAELVRAAHERIVAEEGRCVHLDSFLWRYRECEAQAEEDGAE